MARFKYDSVDGVDHGAAIVSTLAEGSIRSIPADLVTNGNFESSDGWTVQAGWSISNNQASVINNSGTTKSIYRTITFPTAGTYRAEMVIDDITTGSIYISYAAGTATLTASAGITETSAGITSRTFYVTVAGTLSIYCGSNDNTVATVSSIKCYNTNATAIGVDPTDLHTDASAASVSNESNSVGTIFTSFGLNGTGANIWQSQSGVVSVGTYALEADANDTPTSAARFYADLSAAPFSCETGKTYKITFDIRHTGTGGTWRCYISDSNSGTSNALRPVQVANTDTTFTTYEVIIRYGTYRQFFLFRESSVTNDGGVYFDNFQVEPINDLIENGTFWDGQGDTGQGWVAGTGWTVTGVKATCVTPGATSDLEQTVTFLTAGTHEFKMDVTLISGGSIRLPITDGTALITSETFSDVTTTGTYLRKIYVHEPGTTTLKIRGTSAVTANITNVSCYPVEDDQSSANDNGFEVHGQLDKLQVAPGAETYAWSGFAADSYLSQPYTSALDFGSTSDFSISLWVKFNKTSSTQYMCRRGNSANSISMYLALDSSANLIIATRAASTTSQLSTASGITPNTWNHVVVTRGTSGTLLSAYVNGVLLDTATVTARDIDTSDPLTLGYTLHATSSFLDGTLSLFKIHNTALTAADIKSLYDNEKTLFTYGAPYRVVDTEYTIDVGMIKGSSQGNSVNRKTNTTISQVQETLYHSSKRTWEMTTQLLPYVSDSQFDLTRFRHFVDSVKRGQQFTLDERRGFDLFEGEYTVVMNSAEVSYPDESDMVDHRRATISLIEQ